MNKSDLHRLIKIEDRIKEIMVQKGLKFDEVEFDIVPPKKMIEIMAYNSPSNISNWKFGRNYERLKTIYDNVSSHSLPYEVVINSDPHRAYLMNNNTLAVQALVISHVYGHVNFFTENNLFKNSRRDIINILSSANKRFIEYEKLYGTDDIEKIIDAGHALQLHTNIFDNDETEDEKRLRIYNHQKKMDRPISSEFSDIIIDDKHNKYNIEAYNNKLWKSLKAISPVEPTEDILRFVIDNSKILDDWQKDILEVLRIEGQYYWPNIKTKYMNEGYAVYTHEQIMDQLFREGHLTASEHGQYNYSNSLVKAFNRETINPYLIGSVMWYDIKDRWDKGRYGSDWNECDNVKERELWDTKEMNGAKKVDEVMRSYMDWFFMNEFLTPDIIDKSDLYVYEIIQKNHSVEYVRTGYTIEEVREMIISSFANKSIPKISIIDSNYNKNGTLLMNHSFSTLPLNKIYAKETMKHIKNIWGSDIHLRTKNSDGTKDVFLKI